MRRLRSAVLIVIAVWLNACAPASVKLDSQSHLPPNTKEAAIPKNDIPAPIQHGFSLPPPKPKPAPETYSVVVNNVRVQDLLFALARDAKVNVDIHPGLTGSVTLNALDQTLPQLLTRISKQVDMRFELDGPNLVVMPDTPFLHTYKVDYVNMSRDTTSAVSVATQIATAGGGAVGQSAGTSTSGNGSSTRIENVSNNRFWETLVQNVRDLLRETDKLLPAGAGEATVEQTRTQSVTSADSVLNRAMDAARYLSGGSASAAAGSNADAAGTATDATRVRVTSYREAASVIANPETGILSVRATSRQHEKVREFLDHAMASARRQVLIEATIAEVDLSQNYQQGIDWAKVNVSGYGFRILQRAGGNLSAPGSSLFEIGFDSKGGNFTSAIRLLESFGNVKVLSSPKISVLNNQTAVLKVVDNTVYFTIESETQQNQTQTNTTFTTTVHTVPVGLVVNVTPQIAESDQVLLNVRPSLSRIIGQASDPNPALKALNITNQIPIIRSREMESVLRVGSGNIAVMGGLMEDLLDNKDDTVPGLADVPVVGMLFQNRNDVKRKTELIVFIRPTVIKEASLDGDYHTFRSQLPTSDFFEQSAGPKLPRLPEPRP